MMMATAPDVFSDFCTYEERTVGEEEEDDSERTDTEKFEASSREIFFFFFTFYIFHCPRGIPAFPLRESSAVYMLFVFEGWVVFRLSWGGCFSCGVVGRFVSVDVSALWLVPLVGVFLRRFSSASSQGASLLGGEALWFSPHFLRCGLEFIS